MLRDVNRSVKARKRKSEKKGSESRIYSKKSHEAIIAGVAAVAQPLCDSEGIELVHIEYQREPAGWILRLYIDQSGGVNLDDCVNISHQLNDLLDINLEDFGPYNLEVTSPGPDRPLAKKADFERFKGNLARIKTIQPINGQKNFKGVLRGMSGEQVKLSHDDKTVDISLDNIFKARLVNYSGEN
jgi:ribosome maturation factor RimP